MFADLNQQEFKAIRLIATKHLSCSGLAKEMKVSRATAAKMISELRKKGLYISTTRDSVGWFYQLRAIQDPELADLVGAGGRGGRDYSTSVDEDLLEHLSGHTKKKQIIR